MVTPAWARRERLLGILLAPFTLGTDYMLFWTGQALSVMSDSIGGMALSIIVFQLTDSAVAVSLGLILQMLPALIMAPLAGIVLDRVSRKTVLVTVDSARAAFTLGLYLLVRLGVFRTYHAYIWLALSGILRAFYDPATMALIPALVSKESVQRANAMYSMGKNTALILGPALAGIIISACGGSGALLSVGFLFLAAALCAASCRPSYEELTVERRPGFGQMWEGFKFYGQVPLAMTLLILTVLVNFCAMPSGVAFQVHVLRTLKSDSRVFGMSMSASAAASLLASFAIATRKRWPHPGRVLLMGIFGMGLSFALAGLSSNVASLVAALVLFGAAGPFIQVPVSTLYQEITPAPIRGRVFALRFTVSTVLAPISTSLVGWSLDTYGSKLVLLALGCGMFLICAYGRASKTLRDA